MHEFLKRREFVKLTSAGMAAASVLDASQVQAGRGANDKLVVALIGCGGRGMSDAGQFKKLPNVEVAYVCDVDEARLASASKSLNVPAENAVSDLRKVLDDKSVDAVIVATPDHWHSLAAILACDAGKHVYVEKPISHNTDSGAEFYGTKGQMFLSRRGKLTVLGDRKAAVNLDVELKPQDDAAHVRNFCDCIRSGTKPNADALTGHLSTSLAHLANIATRVGRSLSFDPIKERFLGDDEANKLIRREYREHWGTPQGA